jgi:diaminohydroxyphosphoribosylaminopyrimidine deaminase/5-amino-6-(5-phosphoribosylamino)uracil reductase
VGKHQVRPAAAMNRALALARRGMGFVRPNPPVGAVLVRDGEIVGEGHHQVPGREHAEIAALNAAGDRARGADLFVTLEPCNHEGKTPPCVPRLVEAGIRRVHIAARDPNPRSGSGAQALAKAGVDVAMGPGERAAAHLIAGFRSRLEQGRPRFALKVASSLDGRIATGNGDSRWISSKVARAWVHRRRREADAILIGAGTARRDNPSLTTRHVPGRSPDRFVVDSNLSVSAKNKVWNEDGIRRVAAAVASAPSGEAEALAAKGVEVWRLPAGPEGRVSLRALAERMGQEGYTNVLVEGGGTLAGALLQEHLIDTVWIATGSLLLGGGGPGWTEGLTVNAVSRAVRIARTEVRPLGPDWLMTLVPESAQWWDPETEHVQRNH